MANNYRDLEADRLVGRRTLVLIVSDGLDTGEPEELARELAWLKRHTLRLLWLNPLLRFDGYAPTARGAAELHRAAQICGKAKEAVVSMFQEARMGKAVDAESASSLVQEISDSVTRNPGALISLARLKTADEYTYMH